MSDRENKATRWRRTQVTWNAEKQSRLRKAQKIERALKRERGNLDGVRIVDIGVGSCYILQYLSEQASDMSVIGVDVGDYRAEDVSGVPLVVAPVSGEIPLASGCADIVLSNFVIEHMQSRVVQAVHFKEIARLLKPGGFAYLAAPNAAGIFESHTGIAFATWLPHRLQQRYVSYRLRRSWMEVWSPTAAMIRRWACAANLSCREITLQTIRDFGELEQPGLIKKLLCRAPAWVLWPAWWARPSMVFILRHEEH